MCSEHHLRYVLFHVYLLRNSLSEFRTCPVFLHHFHVQCLVVNAHANFCRPSSPIRWVVRMDFGLALWLPPTNVWLFYLFHSYKSKDKGNVKHLLAWCHLREWFHVLCFTWEEDLWEPSSKNFSCCTEKSKTLLHHPRRFHGSKKLRFARLALWWVYSWGIYRFLEA